MKLKTSILMLAVTCLSAPAFAADKSDGFDVELGGYFKGYVNYTKQDEIPATDDVRDDGILRRTEVHFNAEKELDNGLVVGAHVEGIADAGADFTVDESYAYFEGDWGQINFGAKDGAAYMLQVAAPSADKDIDGIRQQISPVNLTALGGIGETDYDQNISAKADKIMYFTPKWDGLQFAASYTPEANDPSRGNDGNALDGDDTTATSQVCDVAVRYQKEISGVKVTAGAGYTHAIRESGAGDDNRQAWNTGLTLGYKGFSIGASYQNDDEASADNSDVEYLAVGIDYKVDKFLFGASYYNKDDQVGTQIDTDRYIAGVNYTYAPGVAFRSSVSYLESDFAAGPTRDATSFVLGTVIDF